MRKQILLVLIIASFTLLLAPAAHAQVRNQDWSDIDFNDWTVVDGNGGAAAGMIACTAVQYCVKCDTSMEGKSVCTIQYGNSYCKCSYRTDSDKVRRCSSSGACTYARR
jgi:hypothetical protein